jgi:prepilin signal peptidase PulO-like enzyme (type II secretory pathway)
MDVLLVVGAVALGVVIGPLLNVVIARVPDRESMRPLPYRRPTTVAEGAVPVVTGVLFGVAAATFADQPLVVVPYLVLMAALVVVSAIDLRVYRIPDLVTFPTLAVSLALVALVSFVEDAPRFELQYALLGLVAYFVALFLPHLVYPKGMGFGDVKLALLMGLFLGWPAYSVGSAIYLVFAGLVLGCILGVVLGVTVNLVRRRRGAFPFGPALALATVVVIAASETLLRNYAG